MITHYLTMLCLNFSNHATLWLLGELRDEEGEE